MPELVAVQDGMALFRVGNTGVAVNTHDLEPLDPAPVDVILSNDGWQTPASSFSAPSAWAEIAEQAIAEAEIAIVANGGARTYRVPKRVREVTQSALRSTQIVDTVDSADIARANRLVAEAAVSEEFVADLARRHASCDRDSRILLGGDLGAEWAARVSGQQIPLQAAGEKDTVPPTPLPSDDDAAGTQTTDPTDVNGWVDPDQPHNFLAQDDNANACVVCDAGADDPKHDPAAVEAFQKTLDAGGGTGADAGGAPVTPPAPSPAPSTPAPVAAGAGFQYDPESTYFAKLAGPDVYDGVGDETDDPNTPPPGAEDAQEAEDPADGTTIGVTGLLSKDPDDNWNEFDQGNWSPSEEPSDGSEVVQLDQESAQALADAIIADLDPDQDGDIDALEKPGDDADDTRPSVKKLGDGVYGLAISEELLFKNAEPFLNFDVYDAVFAATPFVDPAVRSKNAQNQPRQAGGKFGQSAKAPTGGGAADGSGGAPTSPPGDGGGTDDNNAATVVPVARLSKELPLVPDVPGRIQQYLLQTQEQAGGDDAEGNADATAMSAAAPTDPALAPPTVDSPDAAPASPQVDNSGDSEDAGPDDSSVAPLYLAEVDPNDTQAVLKLLAIIPADAVDNQPLECYSRQGDAWVGDDDDLTMLQGATPPPCVEITDPDELQNVESQISSTPAQTDDSAAPATDSTEATSVAAAVACRRALTAAAAYLPGGGLEFATVTEHVIDEETGALTASQRAGAIMLSPYTSENDWPEDIYRRVSEFVAGKEVTPKDAGNAERLRQYWEHGEGAAKIRWGEPGDWQRCVDHVSKFMGERARGYCQIRHHSATGFYAGHAPTEQRPH